MAGYVHRDILAGYMAGNLEKEDYFGEPYEIYGVAAVKAQKEIFITEDKLSLGVWAYNACIAGAQLSSVEVRVLTLHGTPAEIAEKKQAMQQELKEVLLKMPQDMFYALKSLPELAEPLDEAALRAAFSGFTFGAQRKAYANAYGGETLSQWLSHVQKGEWVSGVRLDKKEASVPPATQLRCFKEALANE